MSALAEILSSDRMLMCSEDLVESAADKPQGQQVLNTALGEYLYLDLYRKKIPRRRRRGGMHFARAAVHLSISTGRSIH